MLMRTFPPAAQRTTCELRRPLFSGTSSRWQLGKCYMPLDIFNQVTDKIPPGPFFLCSSTFSLHLCLSSFLFFTNVLSPLSQLCIPDSLLALYYPLYLSLFTCVYLRQTCLVARHSV